MKKNIILIVSLCMLMLGFTACGEESKTEDYNGITYDQLKTAGENLAASLIELTDEDIEYAKQSSDEVTINLVTRWIELKPTVGTYIGVGNFSVSKSGKTVTTTQIMDFSERDVMLTCVYDYTDMMISDITLDEIYTLGETMRKAAMNTVIGLGTVFLILILISLIIWSFKFIGDFQKRAQAPKQPQQPAAVPAADAAVWAQVPAAAPLQPRQPEAEEDDLELIAVIAAAVAAASGTSTDAFVVRSIRKRR